MITNGKEKYTSYDTERASRETSYRKFGTSYAYLIWIDNSVGFGITSTYWFRGLFFFYFPNGRYIDCLSLTYATSKNIQNIYMSPDNKV
jgi:hypothetical protein